MHQYNATKIKKAIAARKRIAKACRDCARKYSPVELPERVIHRICTRRKLYNFLEAIGENIPAVMHAYDLAVPRDTTLKPTAIREEKKPDWLNKVNKKEEEYIF